MTSSNEVISTIQIPDQNDDHTQGISASPAFATVPLEYQWILGLCLPLIRMIFVKALIFVSSKSAGGDNSRSMVIACTHYMESNHAIFVAIILGNVTPTTVYCIIGIDFAINIYHALNIVYVFNHRNAVRPFGNDHDEADGANGSARYSKSFNLQKSNLAKLELEKP